MAPIKLIGSVAAFLLLMVVVALYWKPREGSPKENSTELPAKVDAFSPMDHEHAPRDEDNRFFSYSTDAIEDFEDWLERYGRDFPNIQKTFIVEGIAIATLRRGKLKAIIPQDPEYALALAVPYELRRSLPDEIVEQLETPVSTHSPYELLVFCPEPGQEGGSFERIAFMEGSSLEVFTFGDRLDVATKNRLSIHGILIDDVLAMDDDPVRFLGEAERLDYGIPSDHAIAVGHQLYTVADDEALDRLRRIVAEDETALGPFPRPNRLALQSGDIEGVSRLLIERWDDDFGDELPELQSEHTEGPKKMLYIRARFSNQAPDYEPNDLATLMARQEACEAYWHENSYGKSSLTTVFTDVITLPNSASYYVDLTSGRLGTLFNDALPLVKAAGDAKGQDWDEANYDFYTMLTTGGTWGYAGVASVNGRRSHLNGAGSSNIRTASHEFGHNLSLRHANYWRTDSTSPIGRDSIPGGYAEDGQSDERIEYGHKFSVMGAQNGGGDLNEGRGHYTPGEKVQLDWLVAGDGDWVSVTETTVAPIRLYRHDVESEHFGSMTPGVARAIKINVDSGDYAEANKRRYWLSYRQLPTNGISETWLRRGLQVDWQRENYGNDGSILLDMTPYTRDDSNPVQRTGRDNNDKEDAVVIIGRTYSDEVADIHFTPIAQGGENPNEWIDVLINIGTHAANKEPVIGSFIASSVLVNTGETVDFSVVPSDPEGDTVYYTWTFGDNAMIVDSLNSTTATKSWNRNGFYPVRVTASDGKGGSDTREIIVQIGSFSEAFSISGRVIHAGLPVEGARINIGDDVQAWTDGNGRYVLPGLYLPSNIVSAAKEGLTFEPQFTNPVVLTLLDAVGRDWIANEDGKGTGFLELAVTPYQSTVPLGAQLKLKALAWDETGHSISANPIWSVSSGGSISVSGVFTPDELGGPFTITAIQDSSEAQALVSVEDVKAVGVVALTPQLSESGGQEAVFQIRRYGNIAGDLHVLFNFGGLATNQEDYLGFNDFANIPDGESSVDISFELLDDGEVEPVEDILLSLRQDSNYTIYSAEASASVDILDDSDQAPVVHIISPKNPVSMIPTGSGLFIEVDVVDDGFPDPPGQPIVTWSVEESPDGGGVNFSPPQSDETVAYFSAPGFYKILISADDGVNIGTAELNVHAGVEPGENPSTEGEAVYFPMDEASGIIVKDALGGDNNGTLVGGASWATIENGISGTGIRFDGIDSQLNIPDADEINLIDHRVRSIALWFMAENPLRGGKQVIYEEGGGVRGLNMYLEDGTLYIGGWNSGGSGWEETYLSTELLDTKWHHVGLVLDAQASNDAQPDAFRAYLDGLEFARGSAAPLDAHSGDIALGANRGNTQYHDGGSSGSVDRFVGMIDDFHLWNRALSVGEMGQLFSRAYIGPEVSLTSINELSGAVIVPTGMGILLEAEASGNGVMNTGWSEVASPEGGFVTFVDAGQGSKLATFSMPGFYKFRFTANDGLQAAAADVDVHYGLDVGVNPVTGKEALYFPLDEGRGGSSLNSGYDNVVALLQNDSSWTSAGGGVSGTAALFNGVDDYVTFSGSSQLTDSGRQKSIALWFKPNETGTGGKEVIHQWGDESAGMNFYLEGEMLYFGAWDSWIRRPWRTFLSIPIVRGQWHHVALVLDVSSFEQIENGALKAYLNGTLVALGEAGDTLGSSSNPGLGGVFFHTEFHDETISFTETFPFTGLIDEFHYYQYYALSVEEVGLLYSFGNVGPVVNAGPDQPSVPNLSVSLSGSATDDGRWESPLVYEWMFAGRPGAGVFDTVSAKETQLNLLAGGTYEFALSAFDGHVTTFDTTLVTVDQPTYFDLFMDAYQSVEGEDREPLSNSDNDIWTNIEEYGFGGSPGVVDQPLQLHLRSELVREEGELYFEFRFPRRLDAALRGLSYDLQFSSDLSLASWSNRDYTELETTPIDENFEEVRLRVVEAIHSTNTPLFGRIRVSLNE